MIRITNTPNMAGVNICGDFYDLYNLVEALHEITIDEEDQKNGIYFDVSTRVLGLCYDIRHAYQGDREVELIDNFMTEEKMKWHAAITPKNNVYYSCNYYYPEMFFIMLALNDLIKLRKKNLAKTKDIYQESAEPKFIWDGTIAIIRLFQAEFARCVQGTLSANSYARWLNMMNGRFLAIEVMETQYLDLLNIEYLNMTREKRIKSLNTIARKIVEFPRYDDYKSISELIFETALEIGCNPREIRLLDNEYPEEIDW